MRYIKPPEFKSVKDLQGYYKKVENDITELLTTDGSARTAKELNDKLSQALSAAMSYLTTVNRRFANNELATAFKEGQDGVKGERKISETEAAAILAKQGYKYAKNGFSKDVYVELQTATENSLKGVKTRVNAVINDLRKTGQDSIYNVQQAIIKDYSMRNIFTVKYSNGAEQPLHAYAAMAARSARIESMNIGAIGSALQEGTDLVEMTTMPQCCKLCGAYQGKVYSISGKDKRFPALFKTVLKNGYALPHPNCRHEFIPFFEEIEAPEDLEKAIQKSKIKYDSKGQLVDVRFQKDIEAYQAWQAGNRQLNAEYLEFERMRQHYAGREEEMPYKTLGAFRKEVRKPRDQQSPTMRRWKNREGDKREYNEIRRLFGEKAPKTLDKFLRIKYNKKEQKVYRAFLIGISDARIKRKLGSKRYPLAVQKDKQGKHIQGHKNFIESRSYLAVSSVEQGQDFANYLVKKYSGTGRLVRDKNGKWVHKEIIESDEVIGFVKDNDGNWQQTRRATIHYAKDGTHIVPA